jgi:hypothetical protein
MEKYTWLACCIHYHAEYTVPLLGEDIGVIVVKKAKLIVIVHDGRTFDY